jgi:hypothetical protein
MIRAYHFYSAMRSDEAAEQFAFDQAFRDRSAHTVGFGAAIYRGWRVRPALSRTALAGDDHRHARKSRFFNQAYGLAYR